MTDQARAVPVSRDSGRLVELAECLRGDALAWFEEQLRELTATRDELVRLAARATTAARAGDVREVVSLVDRMDDLTFEASGSCDLGEALHEAYTVEFDALQAVRFDAKHEERTHG